LNISRPLRSRGDVAGGFVVGVRPGDVLGVGVDDVGSERAHRVEDVATGKDDVRRVHVDLEGGRADGPGELQEIVLVPDEAAARALDGQHRADRLGVPADRPHGVGRRAPGVRVGEPVGPALALGRDDATAQRHREVEERPEEPDRLLRDGGVDEVGSAPDGRHVEPQITGERQQLLGRHPRAVELALPDLVSLDAGGAHPFEVRTEVSAQVLLAQADSHHGSPGVGVRPLIAWAPTLSTHCP